MRWSVLFLLSLGCVSQNNHELVKIQLDATRMAMSTQDGLCRADLAAAAARIRDLEVALVERDLQIASEVAIGAHQAEEIAALHAERAALLLAVPKPAPPKPGSKPPSPVVTAALDEVTAALGEREEEHLRSTRAIERHRAVEERFAELVAGGWATVLREGRASVIRLPAAKLFNEGQTVLSPRGEATVDALARGLVDLPGYGIELRGHTDASPYHSADHPSNWELGFARSVTVLRTLEERDVRWRLVASSFADTDPIAPNDTPEGRKDNARVEVWLWPRDPEPPSGPPPEAPGAPSDG